MLDPYTFDFIDFPESPNPPSHDLMNYHPKAHPLYGLIITFRVVIAAFRTAFQLSNHTADVDTAFAGKGEPCTVLILLYKLEVYDTGSRELVARGMFWAVVSPSFYDTSGQSSDGGLPGRRKAHFRRP
jgi:hypothetical protein